MAGLAALALLASAAAAPDLSFEQDDSGACVRFHRPGYLLFYKETVVHPIAITLPAALVLRKVPPKWGDMAPFVGSSKGGDVKEYRFGPLDEQRYRRFYERHRFAATWKKGGWDALRHVEIMAAGTFPVFRDLRSLPSFALPFLPVDALLAGEEALLPFERRLEGLYNATVSALLAHARRCLSSESMAARLLRTLGLWPTRRPLKILYVACGWGFASLDDGWQGPVSIGLFLGLQALLARYEGSRIVDAPEINGDFLSEHTRRSHLWYCFRREASCRFSEENLRRLMYGYGFSYARRLPRSLMATEAERADVRRGIANREFDAVIYGKVGPTQGCDPLPYMKEVQEAGYPPGRVALVYGGDFGLGNSNVSTHLRMMGEFGTAFVREMDAPDDGRFSWKPGSVLPQRCYTDNAWRGFFKLWDMRLKCWGCEDIDAAVFEALWPGLRQETRQRREGLPWPDPEECWSGRALLPLPVLARGGDACGFAERHLPRLDSELRKEGVARHFREAFGVEAWELRAGLCGACRGLQGCRHRAPEFMAPGFKGGGRALAELREAAAELREYMGREG